VRDRLGEFEDRFFSTVFFGSSLLFLAMLSVSMAIAGGILASSRITTGQTAQIEIIYFGRAIMLQISNVYALRMAGVLMISLGTIWLRTGLMPRWLAVITDLVALSLLVVISHSPWITLIFPAWVLMISVFILLKNIRKETSGWLPSITHNEFRRVGACLWFRSVLYSAACTSRSALPCCPSG